MMVSMNTRYRRRSGTRDRILDTATDLFYRRGIRATGVDTIIAASGVAKRTFYTHFASKDELVLAFVALRDVRWRAWLEEAVARLARTPEERPLAVFDALAERLAAPDYRGCAQINTMVETADRRHPAHQAAAAHKARVRDYLRRLIAEAGYAGAEALAEQFSLLVDGALVVGWREGTPRAARVARTIAARLLAAAHAGESE